MSNKGMIGLVVVAAVLGGAAYFVKGTSKPSAPQLNGRQILPELSVADVARIEIGGKTVLTATESFSSPQILQLPQCSRSPRRFLSVLRPSGSQALAASTEISSAHSIILSIPPPRTAIKKKNRQKYQFCR